MWLNWVMQRGGCGTLLVGLWLLVVLLHLLRSRCGTKLGWGYTYSTWRDNQTTMIIEGEGFSILGCCLRSLGRFYIRGTCFRLLEIIIREVIIVHNIRIRDYLSCYTLRLFLRRIVN